MGNDKLWRLYEKGSERIDKDFNIIKVLKGVKKTKILMKDLVDDAKKASIYTSNKICIDIDSSGENDNNDSENSSDPEDNVS